MTISAYNPLDISSSNDTTIKAVLQCALFPLLVWAVVPRSVLVSRTAIVSYGVTLKTPKMLCGYHIA